MTHARTLPRYVGAAGLVAGLLVAFPSLSHASANPSGFHVLSSKSTGVKTGQYIQASVHSAYNHGTMGNQRIYTRQMVPVATSTLRVGALGALSRGITHPGLFMAITAAGFIYSATDGILTQSDNPYFDLPQSVIDNDDTSGTYMWDYSTQYPEPRFNSPGQAASHFCANSSDCRYISHLTTTSQYDGRIYFHRSGVSNCCSYITYFRTSNPVSDPQPFVPDPYITSPAYESDLELLDSYIPPQLYDELYNGGPVPEWQDEITVLGAPATYVQPTGEQAIAPEVARAVGKWGENVAAQLEGQEIPHPDAVAGGATATDSLYEDLNLDGPVPDFPTAEPEWQVETIDELPSYNIGIGSGQCPPPTVITLPFPLNSTLTLNWQPFCDLAAMIRGAVIAVAMILSLYIVLRRG